MSLIDLRKKCTRSKSVACSVDEFIDDAHNYAHGYNNVVSLITGQDDKLKQQRLPYRKATFTLSEECIDSLGEFATQTGNAKSHLIRMLIRQFGQASPDEQRQLLRQQDR